MENADFGKKIMIFYRISLKVKNDNMWNNDQKDLLTMEATSTARPINNKIDEIDGNRIKMDEDLVYGSASTHVTTLPRRR